MIIRMPSLLTMFETFVLPRAGRALTKANIDSCTMHRYYPLWYHGHAYRSECCMCIGELDVYLY